jgi:D-sedoheptulose 7-phosphate isomerase
LRQTVEQLSDVEAPFLEICQHALATLQGGGTIFVFGNGGSSADAEHFAAELTGRYKRQRGPLPAIHIGANSAELSAISNDFGFEESFSMPLAALAKPGDFVIGLSTSGRSKNVLKALAIGHAIGAETCLLTGPDPLTIVHELTVILRAPGSETARIQEMHHFVLHVLAEVLDEQYSEVQFET